jgi:hypothetical protein
MKVLSFFLALCTSTLAHASVFNAADILPQNAGSVGLLGEILLSDPSSEGLEAHGRYGLSDDLNVGVILGNGSKAKRFRFGGEAVYNFIPDWEGQVGLSALGSAIFLRRPGSGGLVLRLAPMVHKQVDGWSGLPTTLYVALPFLIEGRSGTYTTGTQLVVGGLADIDDSKRYFLNGEAGIKLAKSESYVLIGAGLRLGELRFAKKEGPRGGREQGGEPEYRDEDFQ